MSLRRRSYLLEAEGGFKLNCATLPFAKAEAYAERVFRKYGKNLYDVLPDFEKNYQLLQNKCKQALNVPRIEMPVIEPVDMKRFHKDLKSGRVDIFAPYAKGKLFTPKNLTKETGKEWIRLGFKDGSRKDDVVSDKWKKITAKKLLPSQSQIWLEKLINNIAKFGVPRAGSPVLKTTIIVSREGYILDGHHRFGQVMLANPDLKISTLYVPVGIKRLIKVGRAYGNAMGHAQKG